MLLYDRCFGPSWEIFGYFRKSSENLRKRSSGPRNNFGKSSEIFRKSSKTSSLVCLYNKQYYMPACGYEFYLLVFNSISQE